MSEGVERTIRVHYDEAVQCLNLVGSAEPGAASLLVQAAIAHGVLGLLAFQTKIVTPDRLSQPIAPPGTMP